MTNLELKEAFTGDKKVIYQGARYKINKIYYFKAEGGRIEVGAELTDGSRALVYAKGKEVQSGQ